MTRRDRLTDLTFMDILFPSQRSEKHPEAFRSLGDRIWPKERVQLWLESTPDQIFTDRELKVINPSYKEFKAQVELVETALKRYIGTFRW